MSCRLKRMGVLMMHTPDMPSYAHTAAYINYHYCAKNGYAFLVERCPRREDMNKDWMWDDNNGYLLVWSKPTLVLRHIQYYDYLLYVDSDAVVTNQDMSIERFVEKHADKDTCILSSQDCLNTTQCWTDGLNAGTLVFVNKPKTIQILKEWIDSPDKLCPEWKYKHTREQMCLNIMRERFYKKEIKLLKSADMNGTDGTWIKHYMATYPDDRKKIMSEHFQKFFKSECVSEETLWPMPSSPVSMENTPTQLNISTTPKHTNPFLIIYLLMLLGVICAMMVVWRRHSHCS